MKPAFDPAKMIKALALLLALVMCLSACGGAENPEETPSAVDSAVVSDETETDQTVSQTETDTKTPNASKTTSGGSTSSKKQTTTTTVSGKTTWDKDYLGGMTDSMKKKGLTILMWREMHPTEQKLVDDFTKKTGCKVKQVRTTEAEYATKLVSLITAKQSPDVVLLQDQNFPGVVTKSMIPLDAKTFRLDDDCWNEDYMDCYRVNDACFGVSMAGSWSCEDCLYVTYYMPSVLKTCGVKETPYQLYKKGQWNWETQYEIAAKVAGAGKGYMGISLQTYDLLMLSAGEDFVTYNGSKFSNKLSKVSDSSLLTKSWQALAKLNQNKLSAGWELSKVQQGKVGLFTAIAYGIYNEGDWYFKDLPGGASAVEAVPVAGPKGGTAYTPFRPKAWGVAKGAKNAEGAAYFLRYWLDAKNCDMDATFLNKQTKEVYNIITKKSHKKIARAGSGVLDYVDVGSYFALCNTLYHTTSANISTVLNSQSGVVDTVVTKVNRDIARIRK